MDEVRARPGRDVDAADGELENATIQQWLHEDVIAVYGAMQADPSRAIPAKQITATLDARHERWLRNAERA